MKLIITVGVIFIVGSAFAQTKDVPKGTCPVAPPTFGACVFNPDTNCAGDNECKIGQLCCNDGCGKICKDAVTSDPKPYVPPSGKGTCPVAPPTFGACVFNPDTNCAGDNECKIGQLCCNDGCGKICKDAVTSSKPYTPPNEDGQCPQAKRVFGTCVFTPGVNCVGDNECKIGQLCCADGCGKICKDVVSKEKKEDVEEDRCPAVAGDAVIGACTFDPKLNCVDDNACSNGKICCSSGCNKVCVNPKPMKVHEATKQ